MAKLYFYYSAMNAGKSTKLLQSAFNYQERGKRVILLTPKIDESQKEAVISSRLGIQEKAIFVEEFTDIFALIYHLDSKECKLRLEQEGKDCGPISCVLVDEAQFLSKDQVSQLTEIVDTLGIPVLCYGLRTDFMGEPFEGSKYLLAWADEIEEVKTICHCGKKATMNIKIDENGKRIECGEQVEIGGNEKYVSVCRDHFHLLRH